MEKIDKILITFSSIFLVLGLGYLVVDPEALFHSRQGLGKPIAKVIKKSNTVKRKLDASVAWSESYTGQLLHPNDQVYSHNNSSALIVFNNKMKLKLQENTLVKILGFDEKQNDVEEFIELKKGLVSVTLPQELTPLDLSVKVSDQSYRLNIIEESELKISKFQDKGQINVVSGKINVIKENQSIKLSSGEQSNLADKITKSTFEVMVNSPINGSKVNLTQVKNIQFNWSFFTDKNIKSTKLELASDEGFQNIVHTKNLILNSYNFIPDENLNGTIYWRLLLDANDSVITSNTYKFDIINFKAPRIVAPEDKKSFYLKDGGSQVSINMEWAASGPIGTSYQIEFSQESKPAQNLTALKTSYALPSLGEGEYKWRIKAKNDNLGETNWSQYSYFSIRGQSNITGLSPASGENKYIAKPNDKISFSWTKVANFSGSYHFQISDNRNFSKVINEVKTRRNSVRIPFSKDGVYYWKVSADKDGESPIQELIILKSELPEPISLPEKNILKRLSGSKESYEVSWPGNRFAQSYIIEIYRDRYRSKQVLKRKTNGNSFKWEGQRAGVYYFRVAIVDLWGRTSRFSKMAELTTPIR